MYHYTLSNKAAYTQRTCSHASVHWCKHRRSTCSLTGLLSGSCKHHTTAHHRLYNLTLPYLTLPYLMGKTFYCLALRPLTGPMRIPELTVRLQNPQVQYSPRSISTRGTIPLPSEGLLTWTYPLTHTLSISKRTSAWKHISTSILVTMTSKIPNQEYPRDPSPESSIKPQNPQVQHTHLGKHCLRPLGASFAFLAPPMTG